MARDKATIHTDKGNITIELFSDRVPRTVANFTGLASGSKSWTDPKSGEEMNEPLYEDIPVHRIIEDFMIQTGDPLGTGRGGPGYTFDDEFHPDLRHDQAGIVSMANRGPNTNGSQFFITLGPQPHLDDRHSVFGKVIDGLDVVERIGSVETDANDQPLQRISIDSIEI